VCGLSDVFQQVMMTTIINLMQFMDFISSSILTPNDSKRSRDFEKCCWIEKLISNCLTQMGQIWSIHPR